MPARTLLLIDPDQGRLQELASLSRLRQHDKSQFIPVVMVTGMRRKRMSSGDPPSVPVTMRQVISIQLDWQHDYGGY